MTEVHKFLLAVIVIQFIALCTVFYGFASAESDLMKCYSHSIGAGDDY